MTNHDFQELIWQKGRELYREMPWRRDTRLYYVLVSELMLQQTQVSRVIPKFTAFVEAFPDVSSLAAAPLADVLRLWQGLGYNRRAKYLHEAAKMLAQLPEDEWPATESDLQRLPGVGPNTAGAIVAYTYNKPSHFIETNIRTVYFLHFFPNEESVQDTQVKQKLIETLDTEHPREFYWALMDYGSHLKALGIRNISQSKHYTKQSPLEGSVRQMRGRIIAALSVDAMDELNLRLEVTADDRFEAALRGLLRDGLVSLTDDKLHLTK